ncbi:MAG: TIGR01906 family membrane protein [Clostridia bacterium]|nr:TIGR01906 family membrane protein [Clostridia bacterium]
MNVKYKKPLNIALTVLFITALTLFILTFAIGLPIYCRFFYYIQIKTLKMEEATGWSYQTIKGAYDEVLNYLTLPGRPFGTGELAWTESEAAHFADCRVLFNLNLSVFIISGAVCLTLILLNRFKIIELARIKGHRPYLISAVVAVALPVIIGALAATDFDRAFMVFHAIFFPGKDNWTFDPRTEQIIEVMPEEFFMNCAIIIGVGLIAFAVALIIADVVLTLKDKKRAALEKAANENNSVEG